MSQRRRLVCSVLAAMVITAISYVSLQWGGEYLLWPGLFLNVMFNGLLLLVISTGDDYYTLPSKAYLAFNVIFYAVVVFITLFLRSLIRSRQKT